MATKTKTKLSAKAAMRVKIAKDALKQLKSGRLTSSYSYFVIGRGEYFGFKPEEFGANLSDVLNHPETRCEACAIGALLAAKANVNGQTLIPRFGFDQPDIHAALEIYFDRSDLLRIERSFERETGFYARNYGDRTDRLRAILTNVITNNGTFRPEA